MHSGCTEARGRAQRLGGTKSGAGEVTGYSKVPHRASKLNKIVQLGCACTGGAFIQTKEGSGREGHIRLTF